MRAFRYMAGSRYLWGNICQRHKAPIARSFWGICDGLWTPGACKYLCGQWSPYLLISFFTHRHKGVILNTDRASIPPRWWPWGRYHGLLLLETYWKQGRIYTGKCLIQRPFLSIDLNWWKRRHSWKETAQCWKKLKRWITMAAANIGTNGKGKPFRKKKKAKKKT